jgi:hypothetical protein
MDRRAAAHYVILRMGDAHPLPYPNVRRYAHVAALDRRAKNCPGSMALRTAQLGAADGAFSYQIGPHARPADPSLCSRGHIMQFRILIGVAALSAIVMLAPASSGAAGRSSPQSPESVGTIVEFDVPGAAVKPSKACAPSCGTQAFANNDWGLVVGTYTDKYVVPHAFARDPRGYIFSFDAPGAGLGHGLNQGTVAYAVTNAGVIAGELQDANDVFHGFVRAPDGWFTLVNVAGAGTGKFQGTVVWDINPAGTTTGYWVDPAGTLHGFLHTSAGATTTFDPPGSVYTYVCEETCINPSGAIAGFYLDAKSVYHGFLRQSSGTIVPIDAPGAGTETHQGTVAGSINAEGGITGYFIDSSSNLHGFIRSATGKYFAFNAPGAATAAFAIDDRWTVAGASISAAGVSRGLSRAPSGKIVEFTAPDAGKKPGYGTRPSTNNAAGVITGWYVDAAGLNHGFVWTPPSPE